MVGGPRRGEVWWGELESAGRRPYLVLTRDAAISVLNTVVCAPVTTRVRSISSEMAMDADDGMPQPCAATFDNLISVPKRLLTYRITRLGPGRLPDLCRALNTALDC